MDRKTKRWLRRNAKIVAVCVAMLYLVAGITNLKADAEKLVITGTVSTKSDEAAVAPAKILETVKTGSEERTDTTAGAVQTEWNGYETYLLAKIAMAEAEGEDVEGKALVVLVVLNRAESDGFPDTIEDVIMEEYNGIHQFSATQDGGRWWDVEPDEECYEAVGMVAGGWDGSEGALYFESPSKSTWHQENLEFLFQHGGHYFYKDKET